MFQFDKIREGLTFDDVLLVPHRSSVLPKDIDLHSELVPGIWPYRACSYPGPEKPCLPSPTEGDLR